MAEVCFVTGGSRGIGRAVVAAFQGAGYRVAACATTEAGAASAAPDLALACDLREPAQIKAAVQRAVDELGALTVVVNNAGRAGADAFDPDDLEDAFWNELLAVNLSGTYHVCKHALPALPDQRGRVINVASTLGLRGVPDQLAYCASKHGVVGLTRALAKRVAPRGITVNAVCPGWVRTEMADQRMAELALDEAELSRAVPLGRFLEPEEVAKLCLYLASEDAGGITGQTLTIDAGAIA